MSMDIAGLMKPYRWITLSVLAGVIVTTSLTLYTRRKIQQAHEQQILADQYRKEGIQLRGDVARLKSDGDSLQKELNKIKAENAKLQSIVDQIKVPPKPGPAPEQKAQLISDLKGMGLELVNKPSTTIAPSLVGITESDGKTIWGWGKENLRVPFLEQKIEAQQNLVVSLSTAKGIAEKLADTREKQADTAMKAADAHQKEADSLRVVVKDTNKALSAERKKKALYAVGAFAAGYATSKAVRR